MDTNDLLDGEIMVSQRWVTENRKVSKSILETSAVLNTTQQMPAVTQATTHATKHTDEVQDTLIRLMTRLSHEVQHTHQTTLTKLNTNISD